MTFCAVLGEYAGSAMTSIRITKRSVEAAAVPVGKDAFYYDDKLAGFGLRVTPRGVRSYIVQYRLPRQPTRRITLGRHGSPWTAEQARQEAIEVLTSARRGIDPLEARKHNAAVAKALRFDDYVQRFVELYLRAAWPATWKLAKRRLELHVIPILKARPLTEVRRADIIAVLDPIRSMVGEARNTHAVLRLLFNWALDRDDIAVSPMHGLKAPPAPKARKRVLKPDEILALWRVSFDLDDPFGQFIRVLICTLQRRNEVASLPWIELDREGAFWHLVGERAKNGVEHIVPLNGPAMAQFLSLGWQTTGFVFTTTGETPVSGFSKQKKRLDALMIPELQEIAEARAKERGTVAEPVKMQPWVIHDIRRTGATQMQALGIPIEVTEKCLNHISGETRGIRGVYNRYEYHQEKVAAFQAWGEFLERLIAGGEALLTPSLIRPGSLAIAA